METEVKAGIAGIGIYIPDEKVSTKEEAAKVALPEKVFENIGIRTIHKAPENEHPSDMAVKAAKKAIEDAGISEEEIDLIIAVGVFKDYYRWKMSNKVKYEIGAKRAATMDVTGGCAAYYQATEIAANQIEANTGIKTVLITCGEKLFGYGWPTFLSSGGQSVILTKDHPDFRYLSFATSNLIKYHKFGKIPIGGTQKPFTETSVWKDNLIENFDADKDLYYDKVKPIVFQKFLEVATIAMDRVGVSIDDISYMVTLTQQYNFPDKILEVLERPDLPTSKEYSVDLGHFSGGDNYILLDKARKDGKIKKGDLILNMGLGGVAWFASIIQY
ncbi:3-oxoacyl-ACP synthase III family protein [Aquimarina hainanensis]|uniref:3-oxoacyl-ACP synthase III family protein n=1 Tax=Aquimarina hainanensis TaxID=1578017 RepID=A0ABW5NAW3_9FLAO